MAVTTKAVSSLKDKMTCNKPRRANDGEHDYVVKACKDGEERIIRYGDSSMPNAPDNPKRKASFRARHKCDEKKDKFSAGYWSCREPAW
jgi:hypothetical protein